VFIVSGQDGLLQFGDVDARLRLAEQTLLLLQRFGLRLLVLVLVVCVAKFVQAARPRGQFHRAHVRRGHTHWHVTVALGRGDFHLLPDFFDHFGPETVLVHLYTILRYNTVRRRAVSLVIRSSNHILSSKCIRF